MNAQQQTIEQLETAIEYEVTSIEIEIAVGARLIKQAFLCTTNHRRNLVSTNYGDLVRRSLHTLPLFASQSR